MPDTVIRQPGVNEPPSIAWMVTVALDAALDGSGVGSIVRFPRPCRTFRFVASSTIVAGDVFVSLGQPDENIGTPGFTVSRLRKAFDIMDIPCVRISGEPVTDVTVFSRAAFAGKVLRVIGFTDAELAIGSSGGGSSIGALYPASVYQGVILAGADPALLVEVDIKSTASGVSVPASGGIPVNPYTAKGATLDTTAWDQTPATLAAGATLLMAGAGDRHGIIASADNGGGAGPWFRRTNVNANAGIRGSEFGGAITWNGGNTIIPCGGTDIYARHAGGGPVVSFAILKAMT